MPFVLELQGSIRGSYMIVDDAHVRIRPVE
jgi:hypothetical protein